MGVVYKITNTVNGKCYIGKSMIGLVRRWDQHRSNARGNRKQNYLYKAMRKHGIEAFTIEPMGSALLQEDVDALEIKLIMDFQTTDPAKGYNCTVGGDGAVHGLSSRCRIKGVRKHTAEARARMSAVHKGHPTSDEAKRKMSAAKRGKRPSPESIRKGLETKRETLTPEIRRQWGERLRNAWSLKSDEDKAAWAEAQKKKYQDNPWPTPPLTEDAKKKCAAASKTWWDAHPEAKEKMRSRHFSDETRRKCATAAKKRVYVKKAQVSIG